MRRAWVGQWVELLESRRLLSLPAGFGGAEIGTPPAPGSDGYSPDTFSLSGGGTVGGTSDAFH